MALRLADTDVPEPSTPRPTLTVVPKRLPPRVYSPLPRKRSRRPMAIRLVPAEVRA